jgi:hypothetical protein
MLVALLAIVAMGAPESPVNPTDPYQIYDLARNAWAKQTYPAPLQYRITVRVSEGSKSEQERYEAEVAQDGDIRESGISDEEAADPHDATGINTRVTVTFNWEQNLHGPTVKYDKKTGRDEGSPDYLGVPLITPTYDFGLGARPAVSSALPAPSPGQTGALATIATVEAQNRAYDVALIGREPVGPFDAYHLQLTPRRDPQKYRLRELWIDAYTFAVLKLVVQGNFINAPMSTVPWLVTFQNVGGLTYIDTESVQGPLVFKHDRTFTNASISFDRIEQPDSTLPVLPYLDPDRTLREP